MLRSFSSLLLTILLLTGCASSDPRFSTETQYLNGYGAAHAHDRVRQPSVDNVSYWDGDHVSGPPAIRISLSEQCAYFYKGGELVGISAISTGREGFGTNIGNFKIIQKDRNHVSSRFGDYVDGRGNIIQKEIDTMKDPKPKGAIYDGAKMPFFMRIVGGTGMHEGFLPGYPASHGCIRMPGYMAETFFNNVSVGTPVAVTH
ncbi:MAG: L,D-transpeptidase family protein [Chthoniobacter sp.]|nr:L,D-transpeptidase family protein [Chthoniobacter sp.]